MLVFMSLHNVGQKNINPEKSETNEISGEYIFSENIKFSHCLQNKNERQN